MTDIRVVENTSDKSVRVHLLFLPLVHWCRPEGVLEISFFVELVYPNTRWIDRLLDHNLGGEGETLRTGLSSKSSALTIVRLILLIGLLSSCSWSILSITFRDQAIETSSAMSMTSTSTPGTSTGARRSLRKWCFRLSFSLCCWHNCSITFGCIQWQWHPFLFA